MEARRIRLCMLGGVATAPDFMEGFRVSLHCALESEGWRVRSQLVYPYGVWSRRLALQLAEAGHDLWLGFRSYARSIGGCRVLEELLPKMRAESAAPEGPGHAADGERTVLVAHSAGGIAALHAAEALKTRTAGPPVLVVMIGSPRIRVPGHLRGSVLYLYAASGVKPSDGKFANSADPICRIGSFGGWSGGGTRLPLWRGMRHSPEHVSALTVIGGHADYFRERAPFVHDAGATNLQVTQRAVMRWLTPRLGPPSDTATGRSPEQPGG